MHKCCSIQHNERHLGYNGMSLLGWVAINNAYLHSIDLTDAMLLSSKHLSVLFRKFV